MSAHLPFLLNSYLKLIQANKEKFGGVLEITPGPPMTLSQIRGREKKLIEQKLIEWITKGVP
jgi:hypothetical protein